MSMYFLDETDDWPEYEIVKEDIRRLDIAHLQLRKKFKETEATFKSDPANEELKTQRSNSAVEACLLRRIRLATIATPLFQY